MTYRGGLAGSLFSTTSPDADTTLCLCQRPLEKRQRFSTPLPNQKAAIRPLNSRDAQGSIPAALSPAAVEPVPPSVELVWLVPLPWLVLCSK